MAPAPQPVPTTYRLAQMLEELLSYFPQTAMAFPFESNANDYSGYGNNGTIKPNVTNGPQFISGKIGNALLFDGADDY